MTTLLREPNPIAELIAGDGVEALAGPPPKGSTPSAPDAPLGPITERQPDKVEPVYPCAQRETHLLANNDLVDLLSHQLLSCATKVQAIGYLLKQVSGLPDLIPPQVLSTLDSVARQLHYLGHQALLLEPTANPTARVSFKPVDMVALVDRVVETFQTQAPDRCLVKVYEAELPPVWGDPDQLQIVLDNLINNALKYSAPESPLMITAEIHRVPTDKDNGQMIVSVTNFGSYIPPAEQEQLFIKFFRGSEGQQAKGYGLGLPLARWLVELHGGQLEVESSIADGTTFWFTVPLAAS